VFRIEHRQRVGGGGPGQAGEIQPLTKIPAVLNQPQRSAQRLEKGQKQSQEQLIDVKGAIAMRRQRRQASQVRVKHPMAGHSSGCQTSIPRQQPSNSSSKRHGRTMRQPARSRKSEYC
jgi:hypothetical protein